MDNKQSSRFFLGANSPTGFFSLYDDFIDLEAGEFLWIIKGGPGCGKSSFMSRIGRAAENLGCQVEYIYCSGDPDSLDALYIPDLKLGYVDGNAPHAIEAKYPAAASAYLDLGAYCDKKSLRPSLHELISLNKKYRALYSRAYDSIGAAQAVNPRKIIGLYGDEQIQAVLRRVGGVINREFGKAASRTAAQPKIARRFISAFTCKGRVFFNDTVAGLCQRVYTLDNDFGMADPYLQKILEALKVRGIPAVVCPDPMSPQRLEAVLIPGLSLGFIAIGSRSPYDGDAYRHVRLDALADADKIRQLRPRFRAATKMQAELLADAEKSLWEAKELHDEIEKIYNPHVDFDGVYLKAQEHIDKLS